MPAIEIKKQTAARVGQLLGSISQFKEGMFFMNPEIAGKSIKFLKLEMKCWLI